MPLQFRRGTDSDRLGITPDIGEPIYTTDSKRLYVGDGATVGGLQVSGTDSAAIEQMIDSAYVQARQTPQDFAYSSLTGAPTNVSSFSNDAGYTTYDSANTVSLVDSAYVQQRQTAQDFAYSSLTGAPTNVSSFTNDAGYTTYDSNNAAGQITAAVNNLVAGAPGALDTLNELAAALGDDANFATTVTNAIAALPDSAEVATIVTSYGYTTYDSSNTVGLVDSAYIQSRQTPQDFAYSSLTGTPNILDSGNIVSLVDSAYIQARQAPGTDSAAVIALVTGTVDSAYVQARQTAQDFAYASLTGTPNILDSADVTTLIEANSASVVVSGTAPSSPAEGDLWYDNVTTGQLYTYVGTSWLSTAGLTTLEFSSITDLSDVDSSTPTDGQYLAWNNATSQYVPTTLAAGTDSATVASIVTSTVDSAYVQALQTPQDFAYSSLTGAPTNVSSFTNDQGYITAADALDSAETIALVDSAYVQLRQTPQDFAYSSLTGAPTNVSTFTNDASYIATGDSASLATLNTTGNVVIGGNLQVNGTTVTVNATDLDVTDNMIYMNAGESAGSPTASIDVGWAANVNDQGSYYHVGLFRDATDQTFKVYHQYTPEPDAAVQINTGDASFALAPFAASTLTGVYQGFDSDVTAAGLATQTYVTTTVDSAYVQARQDFAYSSLTGAPTTVSSFTNDAGYTTYDSANTLSLIDSAYIAARTSAGTDSATVVSLITGTVDSAYVNGLVSIPSGVTVSGTAPTSPAEGDLWYDNVTTGQLYTYVGTSWLSTAGLTTLEFSSITDLSDVDSSAPTDGQYLAWSSATSQYVPTTLAAGTDSGSVVAIVTTTVDSAYVQSRQTAQDFAYASLTGAPTNVSSFANDAGYLTAAIDSTGVTSLIDAAVAALVDTAPTTLDTLNELAAALGDDANFSTTVTNAIAAKLDSAQTIVLIDSAYVQARQTAQDFAYSSLTGAPNVLDSADVLLIAGGAGGGIDSAAVISLIDSAYINARVDAVGGGGGVDSAQAATIFDEQLLLIDIGDIVGADGNPGELLQSNGNGNSSWVDMKLIARQKAFAMSLIFS